MSIKENLKRIFVATLTALFILTFAVGCGDKSDDGSNMEKAKALLAVGAEYSSMTLEVRNTDNGITLVSTYSLVRDGDGVTVSYSIQRPSTFDVTETGISLPEGELVRTVNGVARVNGSQVTHQSGEPCPYDLSGMGFPCFTVNESTVNIIALDDTGIEAEITDSKSFFGTDVALEDNIKMIGTFTNDRLATLTFRGADEGRIVEMQFN